MHVRCVWAYPLSIAYFSNVGYLQLKRMSNRRTPPAAAKPTHPRNHALYTRDARRLAAVLHRREWARREKERS